MPSLLVLAAGMGSRYGGLKQLDPVGPGGETLLDYSVHDAIRAGFDRVVFLIRRDIEKEFREKIVSRYGGKVATDCVFQQLTDLPGGVAPPPFRTKPWGTAHAVWCARGAISGPFASINADDFYGADAFRIMGAYLRQPPDPASFAMVGYRLDKTLSEHGSVARGICAVDANGLLQGIEELTDIAARGDGTIGCGPRNLAPDTPVSMNFWGFTPRIFPLLEQALSRFLSAHAGSGKTECYLPTAVAEMIAGEEATVRVLPSSSDWFGVTYKDDRPRVTDSIRRLVANGDYPSAL
ncbi:MAG: NTP transferase domain-containing protein [Chthoniobacterales bacterium]|nr:NTP transferase domain-containing protein [Chthoniobacterales bacterium]